MYEVNTDSLVQTAQAFDDCGNDIRSLDTRLRQIASKRFMSNTAYVNVMEAVFIIAELYDRMIVRTRAMAKVVRTVSVQYAETESDVIAQGHSKLGGSSSHDGRQQERGAGSQSVANGDGTDESSLADDFKTLKDWAEFIDEGKLSGETEGYAGDAAALLAFATSFAKLFDKESWQKEGGWKLLLDLCKDSMAGWKKLYDRYMDMFGASGFNGTGLFSYTGQKGVAGLGVITSALGMISSFQSLYTGNYQSGLDAATQFIDKGGKSVAGFGKSIYDAKNVFEAVSGGSKGVLAAKSASGAAVMALIDGGIGIVTQSAKSFDKYVMADGNCTFNDLNEFTIDVCVSGLYYGLGGSLVEAVSGYSGEDVSEAIKDWARGVSKAIHGGS